MIINRENKNSLMDLKRFLKIFLKKTNQLKINYNKYKVMLIFLKIFLIKCFNLQQIKIKIDLQIKQGQKLLINSNVIIKKLKIALSIIVNNKKMKIVDYHFNHKMTFQKFKNKI